VSDGMRTGRRRAGPRRAPTAQEQLERLLYLIPAAARKGGARLSDLAEELGVDRHVLLRDINDVTARSFYMPAGAVETFTLFTDGRRVFAHTPVDFHRPVRLTEREALALGLGLRALAADAEPERRPDILALASRLEAGLVAPRVEMVQELRARVEGAPQAVAPRYGVESGPSSYDPQPEYEDAMMLAFDDDGFRGVVADAIELRRVCTLLYLKPGEDGPQERHIAPHRLLYAEGMWYVAAHDLQRKDLRIFRLDRVLNAWLSSEGAPAPPPGLDELLQDNGTYIAAEDVEVSVRYSPRIARWIIERDDAAVQEEDGSVVVTHRVADPRWIVRHVLQYGGDAVIEAPPEARSWVRAAARTLA
jgi:proteasome accessory factor C